MRTTTRFIAVLGAGLLGLATIGCQSTGRVIATHPLKGCPACEVEVKEGLIPGKTYTRTVCHTGPKVINEWRFEQKTEFVYLCDEMGRIGESSGLLAAHE